MAFYAAFLFYQKYTETVTLWDIITIYNNCFLF